MYKVLITTVVQSSSGGSSPGVHTLIVEFSDRESADNAINIINAVKPGYYIHLQRAIALY